MDIQVATLSTGTVQAQHERPREKPLPLSVEQREASVSKETTKEAEYLPVSPKNEIPDLKRTTSDLEHIGLAFNRRLKFVIDQESREVIIKVIDNETDKVIKVLPPEELQRLHNRISETIGFLFDRMV
ncbi:MAG: flagellar protein FlaG [Treponema sp.]|jgi:flagellar protein FlaG|nr:flagellar protein FlaG [Treponema sp.]